MAYIRGKNILMICFSWPPLFFGVGMYRGLRFARHLARLGWNPTVIVSGGGEPMSFCPEEDGTIKGVRVIRTDYRDILGSVKAKMGQKSRNKDLRTAEISSRVKPAFLKNLARELLTIPDENKGWYKPALREIEKLLKTERFDAIFSSSPPETSHLIAKTVKIRNKIPWLADLRDPWAYNHYVKHSKVKNFFLKITEENTLKYADKIVVVSDSWRDKLAMLYPGLKGKINTITNSFDKDEMDMRAEPSGRQFVITYTGKLHKDHQDPEPFFRVLNKVMGKSILEPDKVKVRFFTYGYYAPDIAGMARKYNLEDIVELLGYVSHKEAVLKQLESTALLFIDWKQPAGSFYSNIVSTYKLYEYLGAKRPILCVSASKNVASGILRSSGAAQLASDDLELEKILTDWFMEFKDKGTIEYQGKEEFVGKYSSESTTRELAGLLEEITKQTEQV